MKSLHVNLFGSFHVYDADTNTPRHFRSDKVRALLAYLLVERHKPHARATLATLLWPELNDQRSRQNLRMTLTRLRQSLADELQAERPLLTLTRHTLQANPDSPTCYIDLWHFDKLHHQCQQYQHQDQRRSHILTNWMQEAVTLYQGDFLANLTLPDSPAFDIWRTQKQEQYHHQTLALLETLTEQSRLSHNDTQLNHYAQRQLQLQPWHEPAHQQLMRLYTQQKQWDKLHQQYQKYTGALQHALQLPPSPETEALYHTLSGQQRAKQRPLSPATPHNLPRYYTPFFGRETSQQQLRQYLIDPDYPLITLLGEGGIGKTRLARQVGHQLLTFFTDGVWFVDLSSITAVHAQQNLIIAIATATNLIGGEINAERLFAHLKPQQALLILDNFEQIQPTAPFLLTLLDRAPNLTLLTTSRVPLQLHAERLFPLSGLPIPEADSHDASAYSSLRLFSERAQRAGVSLQLDPTTLPHLTALCHFLQGVPLALELAATLLRHHTLAELNGRIRANLDTLQTTLHDVPPQHRSLRAVFAQSWQQLNDTLQYTLAQLTAFAGTFTLEAACAVLQQPAPTVQTQLTQLIQHFLLQNVVNGRYRLHPRIHHFAQEKLPTYSQQPHQSYAQHSRYYLTQMAQLEADFLGPTPQQTVNIINNDLQNHQQAWQWAITHHQITDLCASTNSFGYYYWYTGLSNLGQQQLQRALDIPLTPNTDKQQWQQLKTYLLTNICHYQLRLAHYTQTITTAQEAVTLAQQLKDIASEVEARNGWGHALWRLGDLDRAEVQFTQLAQLAHHLEDPRLLADCYHSLGTFFQLRRHDKTAMTYTQQAITLYRQLNHRAGEGQTIGNLGQHYRHQGHYSQAHDCYAQSQQIAGEVGDRHAEGIATNNLAHIHFLVGDYAQIPTYAAITQTIAQEVGNQALTLNILDTLALTAYEQQNYTQMIKHAQQMVQISGQIEHDQRHRLAHVRLAQGQCAQQAWEPAHKAASTALAIGAGELPPLTQTTPLLILATIAWQQGQHDNAQYHLDTALTHLQQFETAPTLHTTELERPMLIYQQAIILLTHFGDKRALTKRTFAQQWLQQTAVRIEDPTWRTHYLEQIPAHKALRTPDFSTK